MLEWRGRLALAGRPAVAATAAALLVAWSGCGGADGDSSANAEASPKATVVMVDGAYEPRRVRIPVGGRVTFVNRVPNANTAETDNAAGFFESDRQALDRKNLFDIHTVQRGEAESVEFDTPGVYRYHSSLDERMKGAIEVVAPPP